MNIPSSVKAFLVGGVASMILAPSAYAQSAANGDAAFSTLLHKITAAEISLAQQELYVSRQTEQISSLTKQLDGMDDLKSSIEPMIDKMASSIERQINSDYPFEMEWRGPRLQKLKDVIKNPQSSIAAKYRRALNIYKFEVNYGQSMEAKKGNHPIAEKRVIRTGDDQWEKDENGEIKIDPVTEEKTEIFDGTYLRYGRLAYVFLDRAGTQAMRFELESREWVDVPSSKTVEIRRAVRIANGEAATNVVMAPVQPMP